MGQPALARESTLEGPGRRGVAGSNY